MADKSFGVKDINLIGTSGTPEIESPNNLNINAINVAISTDMSVGSDLTVTGHTETGTLKSSGISTFVGHVALSTSLTVAGISTFDINTGQSVEFRDTSNNGHVAINMASSYTPQIQFISHDNDIASISGDSNANMVIAAGNTLNLRANTSEKVIIADGNTDIYASDVKKLAVTSDGISVAGIVTALSGIVTYYGDGSQLSNIGAASTADPRSRTLAVSGITSLGTDGGARFIEIDNDAITFKSSDNNASILGTGLGGLQINPGGSEDSVTIGTYAIFKSSGNVTLNNGGQGSTQVLGPLDMREDFYNTVGVTSVAQLRTTSLQVSGISTFSNNVTVDGGDVTFTSQGDKLIFTVDAANPLSGGAIEIPTSGSGTAEITGNGNQLRIYNNQDANHSIAMRAGEYYFQDESADYYALFSGGVAKLFHPDSAGGITEQKFETNSKGVAVAGIVTAISGVSTFYGDVSKAAAGRWYLGAGAGNTSYFFTGIGFTSVDYAHNPVIHLARGQRYEFVNEMGAHPFQIQSGSIGGDPYDPGVTNNNTSSGTIAIEVPFNAPNQLFYQCTSHSGMGGTFTIYPSI